MRYFATMAVFGALILSAPAQAELLVSISKSQQRLSVTVDGEEAYRWPVSTGRKGYSTPTGSYRPTRLERDWYSRKYDMAPMPYSVFFHRGYAVHGTTETANLGRPASHGCVRLQPENASVLFSMVRRYGARHTKVVVLEGALPRLPGAQPMVQAPTPHLAKAEQGAAAPAQSEHLSAKAHEEAQAETRAGDTARDVQPAPKPVVRVASLERLSHSVGSDAQVLREREAWLKAIDRKYGLAH